jgi:hypothetical protein
MLVEYRIAFLSAGMLMLLSEALPAGKLMATKEVDKYFA